MRIAIIGYGKMGKAVEAEAKAKGHSISFIIDQPDDSGWKEMNAENTDAAIEFTAPASAMENFNSLLSKGIKVVTGTTGWNSNVAEVKSLTEKSNGSFIYGSNFSPGMNILFLLNKKLASLMNRFPEYDVSVSEAHHRHKKDAPGGSSISLANDITSELKRKEKWVFEELKSRPPEENEISISVTRAGEITGKHEVTYSSPVDEITISHEAYNRRGFALGAILAAEWLQDKKGFYQFNEIFEL